MQPSETSPLELSFAQPAHGWLPVRLAAGTSTIEFAASDALNNPVEELIDALHRACGGREASVWWHLEPGGYYFEFAPIGDEVELRVLFTENSDGRERTEVIAARGTKQELLLPLWHGLRQLQSLDTREPHWPNVDYGRMENLGEQMRATKDPVAADLLSYSEFGRLRLRSFLPAATAIVEQENFEWMDGLWWHEGIGFTWFGRLMSCPDDTAGLEILFEELDSETVTRILKSISLPIRPGMRAADLQVVLGTPQTTEVFTTYRRTYCFRVGSIEAYEVGCTVRDDSGLIHVSVIRSDIRRKLALAAARPQT